MKYEYVTDAESLVFDARNDEEAIKIAKRESAITEKQIEDGAWLRVYDPDGAMIYQVEEVI